MTPVEQKQEAVRLLVQGKSNRAAARAVGVSEGTVRAWLKRPEFSQAVEEGLEANAALGARIYRAHLVPLIQREIAIALGNEESTGPQAACLNNALKRAGVIPVERVEITGRLASMSDAELEALIAGEVATVAEE